MNRRLFLRPMYGLFGRRGSRLVLFAFSGVLHELGLSFPAGGGWGLPLGYFLLQGVLWLLRKSVFALPTAVGRRSG
jgi:alginate O-acetyltransferase complex protein AlgI